ncbi:hypothetical protein MCG98_10865 [Ruminococcus sp. OA3]|uniref:hypothetical protein n=1 Tax=Ruminococcus sp. OA3 TaxID=2914164 RepID=UPI001F0697E8|nr:hypothetical protein [Ruminococcus sp. OA3]MCH1983066.1 hypothetical protein [Ruminococcus sp. OA3]
MKILICDDSDTADMIFLDIFMNPTDGTETARELRSLGCSACPIFISPSREFAVDSYSVQANYYLVKPVRYEDISSAMVSCMKHHRNSIQVFLENDEPERAREYLKLLVTQEVLTAPTPYCVNPFINATISYYFGMAEKAGIQIEHSVDLDENIPYDSHCVFLSSKSPFRTCCQISTLIPSFHEYTMQLFHFFSCRVSELH